MLYLTYAASFISLILGIIEPFAQKMQTVLILSFLSNFLVGISYFFTSSESTSGAVICFIACIQVIINYFFDRKEKKIPMALIVIYALSFIIVSIKVYSAWFDAFSFAATMLYVASMVQTKVSYYRVLYALNSSCWIIYDLFSGSYPILTTHIILAVFTFAAMFINRKKEA